MDRAYSHYWHQAARGFEPLGFEEAIDREPERLAGELERMLEDESYVSFERHHHSYLARGVYADQLREWMVHFPHGQMLVLQSEDLYREPAATLGRVLEFLELPAWTPPSFPVLASAPVSRSGMSPATRAALVERYAPHNEALSELLGHRLTWDG